MSMLSKTSSLLFVNIYERILTVAVLVVVLEVVVVVMFVVVAVDGQCNVNTISPYIGCSRIVWFTMYAALAFIFDRPAM